MDNSVMVNPRNDDTVVWTQSTNLYLHLHLYLSIYDK